MDLNATIASENAAIAFSGRPVWDHYVFGRSSRGSETPITSTVHRHFSSSSLWAGSGDHPRIDDAPAIAAENAAIAFPAGLSGTHYFFGGSSRGSETPITTTVHRDLSSSSF